MCDKSRYSDNGVCENCGCIADDMFMYGYCFDCYSEFIAPEVYDIEEEEGFVPWSQIPDTYQKS